MMFTEDGGVAVLPLLWPWGIFIETLRPRKNDCRLSDDIWKLIFFHENCCILIQIQLEFVRRVQLVLIQHWVRYWLGTCLAAKPISEPMMAKLIKTYICITLPQWVNSLWPSYAIWWQISWSTLAQVMACCLTAPSHYLNQCWLIISEVHWYSYQGNFARNASTINP